MINRELELREMGELDRALTDGRVILPMTPEDREAFDIVGYVKLVKEKYNGNSSLVTEEEANSFKRK